MSQTSIEETLFNRMATTETIIDGATLSDKTIDVFTNQGIEAEEGRITAHMDAYDIGIRIDIEGNTVRFICTAEVTFNASQAQTLVDVSSLIKNGATEIETLAQAAIP